VWPQPAPPDCGLSTSAAPNTFGAISPAGKPNHYKIVIIGKTNLSLGFVISTTEQIWSPILLGGLRQCKLLLQNCNVRDSLQSATRQASKAVKMDQKDHNLCVSRALIGRTYL
jgi:hypothetical protein